MRLASVPLRTLDALHLAIATGIEASAVATADETLGDAAAILGLHVQWFGGAEWSGPHPSRSLNKVGGRTSRMKKDE